MRNISVLLLHCMELNAHTHHILLYHYFLRGNHSVIQCGQQHTASVQQKIYVLHYTIYHCLVTAPMCDIWGTKTKKMVHLSHFFKRYEYIYFTKFVTVLRSEKRFDVLESKIWSHFNSNISWK